jgi:hypothetical protein
MISAAKASRKAQKSTATHIAIAKMHVKTGILVASCDSWTALKKYSAGGSRETLIEWGLVACFEVSPHG